ncbi:hypothetical protein PBN151_1281 [Paenibacillus sp. NAIST15-1]|nr:hypothetical protein PBN151_1281 [Paenibacillus sp. NAIST15-1]
MDRYLNTIMNRLANIIHNESQHPSKESCNLIIDSLSRLVKEYNEEFDRNIDVTDYRKKNMK